MVTASSYSPLFLGLAIGAILVAVASLLLTLCVALFVRREEMRPTPESMFVDRLRRMLGHGVHPHSLPPAPSTGSQQAVFPERPYRKVPQPEKDRD
jgi:hypothetical protein